MLWALWRFFNERPSGEALRNLYFKEYSLPQSVQTSDEKRKKKKTWEDLFESVLLDSRQLCIAISPSQPVWVAWETGCKGLWLDEQKEREIEEHMERISWKDQDGQRGHIQSWIDIMRPLTAQSNCKRRSELTQKANANRPWNCATRKAGLTDHCFKGLQHEHIFSASLEM